MTKKSSSQNSKPSVTITELHMGQFLRDFLKKHRLSKAALSRAMGIDDGQMQRLLKRKDVKASVLIGFSHTYHHNFFADLAATLPDHYVHTNPDTTLQNRINELEEQLMRVTAERDVLKAVLGSKTA